jgi:hypothetical protein
MCPERASRIKKFRPPVLILSIRFFNPVYPIPSAASPISLGVTEILGLSGHGLLSINDKRWIGWSTSGVWWDLVMRIV